MINRKQRIESILFKYFKNLKLEVSDDSKKHIGHNNFDGSQETHFKIILEKNADIDKKRLEIHRKINELLEEEFKSGMHSLEIKINYN